MAKKSDKALEYERKIQRMKWPKLKVLWSQIKADSTPEWDDGKALEYLVIRGFQLNGLEVEYPFDVPPGGKPVEQIDGAVFLGNLVFLIECKDKDKEDVAPISNMEHILMRRPPTTLGCVFVAGAFTGPAIFRAGSSGQHRLLLWQEEDIDDAMATCNFKEKLIEKYRILCLYGMHDHSPNYKELEVVV